MNLANPHFAEPHWLWLAVAGPTVAWLLFRFADRQALKDALMTPAAQVPPATRRRTELFTAPYWGPFTQPEATETKTVAG